MASPKTAFKYAEFEGNTYRWPENDNSLGDIIKMERWNSYNGGWGVMAFGTDIRDKATHFGVKLPTPEHVIKETGSKDSIQ